MQTHHHPLFGLSGAPLLWTIGAASAVELIAAAVACQALPGRGCSRYYAWAVTAGTVSLFIALVMWLLMFFSKGLVAKLSPWVATFLALWWIPGAFVTTFKSPFVNVGNGYFGSWAAFLFSLSFFQQAALPKLTRWAKGSEPAGEAEAGTAPGYGADSGTGATHTAGVPTSTAV